MARLRLRHNPARPLAGQTSADRAHTAPEPVPCASC